MLDTHMQMLFLLKFPNFRVDVYGNYQQGREERKGNSSEHL